MRPYDSKKCTHPDCSGVGAFAQLCMENVTFLIQKVHNFSRKRLFRVLHRIRKPLQRSVF